jgi:CRP-like cAMP-binding protein
MTLRLRQFITSSEVVHMFASMVPEESTLYLNWLLASLPTPDFQRLRPYLKAVKLPVGKPLHEVGEPIRYVYFPTTCVVSSILSCERGHEVEVATTGYEGMVGVTAVLLSSQAISREVVVIPGEAWQLAADVCRREFQAGGVLRDLLMLYLQAKLVQSNQIALCHHFHTIEERVARWLLTVGDMVRSDEIDATHEMISALLGARRSGVSVAASVLRHAGLIDYIRGDITILNRKGLTDSACECYPIIRDSIKKYLAAIPCQRADVVSRSTLMLRQSEAVRGQAVAVRYKSQAVMSKTQALQLQSEALLSKSDSIVTKRGGGMNASRQMPGDQMLGDKFADGGFGSERGNENSGAT